MEVAFEMNAWQPHIKLVKHNAVRQTNRAEQFRLGEFKEPNVRALEDDTRGVDIAPAHTLLDRVFLVFSHWSVLGLRFRPPAVFATEIDLNNW